MDIYWKLWMIVLCGCGAALVLDGSPLRHPASLCCVVLGGILLAELVPELKDLVERLLETTADTLFQPVLKAVGIGILTQIGSSYCGDLGEKSLAGLLEQGGILAILVVSLPLFSAVLDLLMQLMEG